MKYQNFVIKNGKFIGKFDEMYKFHKDPWNLIKNNRKGYQINYHLIFKFCDINFPIELIDGIPI